MLLNEVTVRPTPAIVYDRKDPNFWVAVIGGDDSAIGMDPADLNEVRRAVLYDEGTLPLLGEGEETAGHREVAQQAPVPSKRDTVQPADPRSLHMTVGLRRPYRAVQFIMRLLVVGRRSPDARPL